MAEKVKIVVSLDPSDAKKGGKEVIQLLNDTEAAAKSASAGLKGISAIGKSGIDDIRKQKNSVEDLDERIKLLTKSRDKWADPAIVARYNRKIEELSKNKRELTGDTKKLTDATDKNNGAWRVGSITVGTLLADVYRQIATRALDVIKTSRQLAFSVEETASKYQTVLGPGVAKANEFLAKNAEIMGVTTSEGQEFVSTSVQIAKGMGMVSEEAVDFGTEWVKTAADFQSFFNVPYEQAFGAIRSGITGEYEPLKTLGIVLSDTEIKERALLNTGKNRAESLTNAEKVQARYQLIIEKSGVAVGDLDRTQDSAANTTRRMNAAFRDIAEEMAQKSIPLWKELATAGLDFSKVLRNILGISITDKIQEERLELNLLSNQLITAIKNGGDRSGLISELNEKYPDYLKSLNAEKLTVEDLSKRLSDYNKFYEEKTLLQIKQEELSKLTYERATLEKAQTFAQVNAVEALIKAEAKLGIEADLSTSFWERRNKVMAEADEQGARMLKHDFKDFTKKMFSGTGLADELKEVNEELEKEQELFRQLETQFKTTSNENDIGSSTTEPIDAPIKPVISPEFPVHEVLEEAISLEEVKFPVTPKIETENLTFLYNSLSSAEQQYTAATSDEERKRHQERIDYIQKTILAKKEGITIEQLDERQAHQDRMQMAAEYIEQLNQGFQLVADFQGAITERRIQSIQSEKDAALSSIDAQLSNNKLSERQREQLLKKREQAEEQYQKKIDKLQHEQFERERIASLAQVAANTAVAVSKVWGQTGIFGVAAQWPVIAMGAIQAGTILAQPNPYLEGGMVEERLRAGMSAPGKKLISINENDKPEFIMNAVSTAKSIPLMNRMNKDPEFADRMNKAYQGLTRPSFSKPQLSSFSSGIDTNALNAAVRSGIAEAMAEVKLYPKISYSDFLEAGRQYRQKQDAVGNQS